MTDRTYALVTGAGGGIGLEVARRLARRGHIVLAAERTEAIAADAVSRIAPDAVAVTCDLADADAVGALLGRIETEWGPRLNTVVLNAGIITPGHVVDTSDDDLTRQQTIMLTSTTRLARAAARAMVARGSGRIVATVSQGALIPLAGSAAYSASKAGLRAFLGALHLEMARTTRGRVTVSGIYPAAVDTPMLVHEALHGGSTLNFVGAVSTIDDVADAIERGLRTGRVEIFVPRLDGVLVRVLQTLPTLHRLLTPALDVLGERGRRRYLARHSAEPATPTHERTRS